MTLGCTWLLQNPSHLFTCTSSLQVLTSRPSSSYSSLINWISDWSVSQFSSPLCCSACCCIRWWLLAVDAGKRWSCADALLLVTRARIWSSSSPCLLSHNIFKWFTATEVQGGLLPLYIRPRMRTTGDAACGQFAISRRVGDDLFCLRGLLRWGWDWGG